MPKKCVCPLPTRIRHRFSATLPWKRLFKVARNPRFSFFSVDCLPVSWQPSHYIGTPNCLSFYNNGIPNVRRHVDEFRDYLFDWWYVCSCAIDLRTTERTNAMPYNRNQCRTFPIAGRSQRFRAEPAHVMFSHIKVFFRPFSAWFLRPSVTVDLKLFSFCI